ncbi:MAG: YqcI/YcgG family protein [bacterium]|nr:YqcI/YcgG family protein [bacterium]
MTDPELAGYARFDHATKTLLADGVISEEHRLLFQTFSRTAMQSAFPCIGAQKVMRDYRVAFCLSPDQFNTVDGAQRTAQYLYRWSREADYAALKQMSKPTAFATCVVVFPPMDFKSENDSERQLWEFLNKVNAYDRGRYPWSDESSNFVYDNKFSMSIGGYAHFILFLSSSALTPARRFSQPMMIFNPHFIFEVMRNADIFADWRTAIREREKATQNGWHNPKLRDYGSQGGFEAPQYALTLDPTFDIGKCPFTGRPRPENMPLFDMQGNPFGKS